MAHRFGPSKLDYTDVSDVCGRPEWQAFWKKAGIYDAVCRTHAVEQAILQTLDKELQNKPREETVQALVQQLLAMGHSMRAIDQYVQDGGFGPIAAYLPEN